MKFSTAIMKSKKNLEDCARDRQGLQNGRRLIMPPETLISVIRKLTDKLREERREYNATETLNGHSVSMEMRERIEEIDLERIGFMLDLLPEDEWEVVNNEGWRGWPDLYDLHMKGEEGKIIETAPNPDDSSTFGDPVRKFQEETAHRSRLRRLIDALNIAIGVAQENVDDLLLEDNYRALGRLKIKIWGEDKKWVEGELYRLSKEDE